MQISQIRSESQICAVFLSAGYIGFKDPKAVSISFDSRVTVASALTQLLRESSRRQYVIISFVIMHSLSILKKRLGRGEKLQGFELVQHGARSRTHLIEFSAFSQDRQIRRSQEHC